ncbi:P1 family peptidase [Acidomonas methanolica]|uniref:L-aminopeptidase/D-esterase n=4 Tax=Acidomonas methanolica TaxID=437 RepID=A0A023D7A8_ACIMT|nr:P1 family peptidase [Acidomonas methanolica]MBU2654666.1 P1 family peptidase [Acidomonas methanolica]TCS27333.1 L-aminopeptidase/D-esterase-like protein [Acidomonas methanolica]GAJ29984.1 L-aminopeptidase/D-esterase [Acidomonas methanolica NBRC 104435]GEK99642.1 peptidase T4 [Acidomonas methanolica NBRC 104435]
MRRRDFLTGGAALIATPALAAGPYGQPGPRNLITDVAGLRVGWADDPRACTGVTVILPEARAAAAVDVRGGGPGTRETDALAGQNLVRSVDAVVLSGGSVYGLASADGVATWLGAQGRGFALVHQPGVPPSPVVPAAILFDLASGGDKNWGETPPYRALGRAAVLEAGLDFPLGTHGAGYGATAGRLKGGLGSASYVTHDGMTVGAIVACNSLGSVIAPGGKRFWAGAFEIGKEFGGLGPPDTHAQGEDWGLAKLNPEPRANTTIACVATDMTLDPDELKRVAIMAQDGLPRAIRPVHSPFDGDIVFALSTGRKAIPSSGTLLARDLTVARIGALAADVLARAIARGVYSATTPPGMRAKAWTTL